MSATASASRNGCASRRARASCSSSRSYSAGVSVGGERISSAVARARSCSVAATLVRGLGQVDRRLALLERLALLDERLRLLEAAPELLRARVRRVRRRRRGRRRCRRLGVRPAQATPRVGARDRDPSEHPGERACHGVDATLALASCPVIAPCTPDAAPADGADSDRGKE